MLTRSKRKLSFNSKKFAPIAPAGAGKHFQKSNVPNFLLLEHEMEAGSKNEENPDSKSQFTPIAPIAPIYINKNNIIYSIGGIYSPIGGLLRARVRGSNGSNEDRGYKQNEMERKIITNEEIRELGSAISARRMEVPAVNREKFDVEAKEFFAAIRAATELGDKNSVERLQERWKGRTLFLIRETRCYLSPPFLARKKGESAEEFRNRCYKAGGY